MTIVRKLRPTGVWMKVIDPERIARKRKRRGYTQADLAALVGCTQQYISLLETGVDNDCSERVANKIADRLGEDVEDLFEERRVFSNSPKPSSKAGHKAA